MNEIERILDYVSDGSKGGLIIIKAELTEANLTEAILTGACLVNANLTRVTLNKARLTGAFLLWDEMGESESNSFGFMYYNDNGNPVKCSIK